MNAYMALVVCGRLEALHIALSSASVVLASGFGGSIRTVGEYSVMLPANQRLPSKLGSSIIDWSKSGCRKSVDVSHAVRTLGVRTGNVYAAFVAGVHTTGDTRSALNVGIIIIAAAGLVDPNTTLDSFAE
jgi:hypothetical protein